MIFSNKHFRFRKISSGPFIFFQQQKFCNSRTPHCYASNSGRHNQRQPCPRTTRSIIFQRRRRWNLPSYPNTTPAHYTNNDNTYHILQSFHFYNSPYYNHFVSTAFTIYKIATSTSPSKSRNDNISRTFIVHNESATLDGVYKCTIAVRLDDYPESVFVLDDNTFTSTTATMDYGPNGTNIAAVQMDC